MKDETTPTTIAATLTRHGNRVSVEWDMAEAAAALDEECAKLREQLATVTAERDAAMAELAAMPIGPAKAAPDETGWWLITARGWSPIVRHIGPREVAGQHVSGAWFKIKTEVQP